MNATRNGWDKPSACTFSQVASAVIFSGHQSLLPSSSSSLPLPLGNLFYPHPLPTSPINFTVGKMIPAKLQRQLDAICKQNLPTTLQLL